MQKNLGGTATARALVQMRPFIPVESVDHFDGSRSIAFDVRTSLLNS